jgi:ATP-binding cassette subfamily G (WHITE) protein 2 (SNQ2)
MRFSAYLRQPANVPKEEKDAYVEEMIELLELQPLGDALIFTLSVEGKSGHYPSMLRFTLYS